ncbi:MAG TPA: phosphoribosylaminoimidazolesuccinocarboxamide synthase, partial [Gemmatimonadales bacterium]|nr:phosphoribosylaminoimidazolesuccinocarboxamide synthase [Gemmatimonadales bacterium]
MTAPLVASALPLPLLRRGKVREVYDADADTLLLVASDRVSAFDVVLREPVPHKGAVLTQLSAFWFERLAAVISSHFLTADDDAIVARV